MLWPYALLDKDGMQVPQNSEPQDYPLSGKNSEKLLPPEDRQSSFFPIKVHDEILPGH